MPKKTNKVSVQGDSYRFEIDIYVFQDGKDYISYCPSLDICSAGTDYIDALENFYEALGLYVDYWAEHHTLEKDLQEHGWKIGTRTMTPPPLAVLAGKPMFNELISSNRSFERMVAPVHIAAR